GFLTVPKVFPPVLRACPLVPKSFLSDPEPFQFGPGAFPRVPTPFPVVLRPFPARKTTSEINVKAFFVEFKAHGLINGTILTGGDDCDERQSEKKFRNVDPCRGLRQNLRELFPGDESRRRAVCCRAGRDNGH